MSLHVRCLRKRTPKALQRASSPLLLALDSDRAGFHPSPHPQTLMGLPSMSLDLSVPEFPHLSVKLELEYLPHCIAVNIKQGDACES